jgi:ribose 5-phosphate isomerase B
MNKPIAIGSDEAGFHLKEELKRYIETEGYEVIDYGCHSTDPVDYPDVAVEVASAVAAGRHERAVLICGTGIGMAIAANKVPGVYAANAHDPYSAARARMSNNAQVLTLGARVVGTELAKTLVDVWLKAEFAGGGSLRKVQKIQAAERRQQQVPPASGGTPGPATSGAHPATTRKERAT